MITVEDFNSVFKEYGSSSIFHCIDTSLISIDSDFSDVTYDFSIVDREIYIPIQNHKRYLDWWILLYRH